MEHRITVASLKNIQAAAKSFIEQTKDHNLIAFCAPMGAGKTTFISAICRELGISEDAVSSPTFAIVNEYHTNRGEPVYHFDFYRITKPEEALDIGLYEYLDSGCLCLMEWPENIGDILPEEALRVDISILDNLTREIVWND